jgi:hypothetical protein
MQTGRRTAHAGSRLKPLITQEGTAWKASLPAVLGKTRRKGDMGNQFFMSPDSKPAFSAPPESTNDPKPGESGNSGRFLFPSLFLLCYLLLAKLSKSLIPLSDCPFVLNRLPVFLENLPVSGKKQGTPVRPGLVGPGD